ncbi:DUF441 domain-containing protein [Acidaminococcus fermentans]|nr:DUF441 domain-containing protein [Acidaminococcus fermentans]MCI6286812.1 DUF441 domain-containing protein [Acidaminococcus fermentans]MDD7196276.1 DUF441 domain-containing protein [Acidaminococcus fermentans]MDY2853483.1 DUF441 domain-containing protein [Acidaminococcus fermentans]MDY4147673.1 DUF441 domain-containing protein [Acidaminococcus fermentans]
MMQPYLILGFMIVLGYLAHNLTVSYAAGLLVLLKLFLPEEKMLYFGSHGVNWGVMLLMAALMVPIATGKIGLAETLGVFKNPMGIASLVIGALVALLGRWGVDLMGEDPEVVAAMLIGTIIGVFLFKGVPVGPMIASGLLYCLMKLMHLFFH